MLAADLTVDAAAFVVDLLEEPQPLSGHFLWRARVHAQDRMACFEALDSNQMRAGRGLIAPCKSRHRLR